VLKSAVGIQLREGNPVRFRDRDAVRSIFVRAVDPYTGVLRESGTSAQRRVQLVDDTRRELNQLDEVTDPARLGPIAALVSPRIQSIASRKPFVFHFGALLPNYPAVQQTAYEHGCTCYIRAPNCWIFCPSYLAACRLVTHHPALSQHRHGVFFNVRSLPPPPMSRPEPISDADVQQAEEQIVQALRHSPNCQAYWAGIASPLTQWTSAVRNAALQRLVDSGCVTRGARTIGTQAQTVLTLVAAHHGEADASADPQAEPEADESP
jgi:hypothetical protein